MGLRSKKNEKSHASQFERKGKIMTATQVKSRFLGLRGKSPMSVKKAVVPDIVQVTLSVSKVDIGKADSPKNASNTSLKACGVRRSSSTPQLTIKKPEVVAPSPSFIRRESTPASSPYKSVDKAPQRFTGIRRPSLPNAASAAQAAASGVVERSSIKHDTIAVYTDVKIHKQFRDRLLKLGGGKQKAEQVKADLRKKQEEKREEVLALKATQRAQIYALNALMTRLENEAFLKFCETKSTEKKRNL
eukprot:Colp12_sorted_trinity150504_noHs@26312